MLSALEPLGRVWLKETDISFARVAAALISAELFFSVESPLFARCWFVIERISEMAVSGSLAITGIKLALLSSTKVAVEASVFFGFCVAFAFSVAFGLGDGLGSGVGEGVGSGVGVGVGGGVIILLGASLSNGASMSTTSSAIVTEAAAA